MFKKGSVPQDRRCIKRGKTQRPSSSCIDTEREAGNGFKEKKGSAVSASLGPLAVLSVFYVFFFLKKREARSTAHHLVFVLHAGILPRCSPTETSTFH